MVNTVLIVDENETYPYKLQNKLESNLDLTCTIISDYSSVSNLESISDYTLYYIRLDAKNHKIINELINDDKIVVLLTDDDSTQTRDLIRSYSASDYIILNSASNGDVALRIANRLINNKGLTVMIVDDSESILTTLGIQLEAQNLSYIKCSNGREAWEYINNPITHPVDLIIADYQMPIMNGYELTKLVRTRFPIEKLPILILSGTEDVYMISRFLKIGANDYIPKPFTKEELIARVSNTLTISDMFKKINKMAMTDYLTGLYNRAYFYQAGEHLLAVSNRGNYPLSLCMIDIDNFKLLNDKYGHNVGDQALIHVANTIKKILRKSDILVRFGGEEFIILLSNSSPKEAYETMQKITKKVSDSTLIIDSGDELTITISSGVTSKIETLDEMVKKADSYMYKAKANGKNQVYTENL